ncbi:hypothetical protein [Geminisphaera colitermitum]|uniref:hypothetical protein n=1 Tax=Geminisphaera colitermitum TaxID=1148786 RepID=UPI000196555B|nr:hypothetical protein [Geminisphaera colitermitum]
MTTPPVQTASGKLVYLCACCMSDAGTWPDSEIGGMVCTDCHTKTNWAKAWLKAAGIRGCVRVENGRRGSQ